MPAKPEAGGFKMGIEPWLGYGLWHVAAEKKLFEAQGLSDVEIVNFTQDKDVNAALASGQLDGANIATHTALVMAAAGLPIKIVAVLDVSMTADAILAGADIKSIADLKGKEVAYEEGTTSHILLNYALAANGLTLADVKSVPMPASDAGAALIAKRVPVAVTYEPYLTLARAQDPAVRLLYTAAEDPGLVSDVFVVREEVLKEKPGQIAALLRAWQAAHDDYAKDTGGRPRHHRQGGGGVAGGAVDRLRRRHLLYPAGQQDPADRRLRHARHPRRQEGGRGRGAAAGRRRRRRADRSALRRRRRPVTA